MMEPWIFKTALFAYLLSTGGYLASILVRRVFVARVSTWILLAAFSVHTLFIIVRWRTTGYGPVVSIYESLSFLAWAVCGGYLIFQTMTKTRVLGAFVAPLCFLLMMLAAMGLTGENIVPDILRGYWVPAHVFFTLTGEALLALACLAGAMYLIQDHALRAKKAFRFSRYLPPLRDLDRINHLSLLWGFVFFTAGILAGAVWAGTVWGKPWQWDPKQVFTFLSWILYVLLIHQRLAIGWKGRKAAFLSILAFAVLLFSLAGVHAFFTTIHDFS